MDGGNPLRRFRRLSQCPAQLVYPGLQHPIAHRRLRPYSLQERLFGHQLAGVFHQRGQERQGFGTERHRLLSAPQPRLGQIESEGSKVIVNK
jgi:hypothetical protein